MKRSTRAAVDLLLRGSLALSRTEHAGFRVDMEYLDRTATEIKTQIATLEAAMKRDRVWRLWTKTFDRPNLGSRAQLGKLLFDKLGHTPRKYTAKSYDSDGSLKDDARASTDKSALDHVALPFVKQFLKTENLKKTLSTYLEGTKEECVRHGEDWFVHPIFNLNRAASFRSSEELPNLQNQPKRNEDMANFVRQMYLPHRGHRLVDFDFSTLEVRIAYTYHKDPAMRKYLLDESTDMHRDTAMDMFMLPRDQVDKKTTRDSAKNQFVFPQFYGSVYFQCAPPVWERMERDGWALPDGTPVKTHLRRKGIKALGDCDPDHVHRHGTKKGTFVHHLKQVEAALWKRFAKYAAWKKQVYRDYLDRGYIDFHTGFRVWTPHSRNDVTNYGTQGAAFHCLLWCLIEMQAWLDREGLRSVIVNQIHDSATLSVHPAELQRVIRKMHRLMTVSLQKAWGWINIPLKAEVEVADVDANWATQKQWVPDEEGVWSLKT